MRKTIAIMLVAFMLALTACTKEPPAPTDTSSSVPPQATEKTEASSQVTEESTNPPEQTETTPAFDERGYLSIKPNVDSRTQYIYVRIPSQPLTVLRLSVPKTWELVGKNGEYQITKDNTPVGMLYLSDKETPNGTKTQEEEETKRIGLAIRSDIFSDSEKESFGRRNAFCLDGKDGETICTLITDYAQTDNKKLVSTASFESVGYNDPAFGVLDLSEIPLSKPILILGNSFIASSAIGDSLKSMIQATDVAKRSVIAESYSYATVSKSWSQYESKIGRGDYAAVFMCGFYSSSDVNALQKFVDLCEKSNTPLVIFPAHNESHEDSAHTKYPNLLFIDWKCEVDDFIGMGVPWSELCINDGHNHSTPLAGYIGAHMIFRAVYGKVPSDKTFNDLFSHMRSPLFEYYNKNGYIRYLDDADILK